MRCLAVRTAVAAATHVWALVAVAAISRVWPGVLSGEAVGGEASIAASHRHASWRSRARGVGWVAAQHGDTAAVLGATEGDHVLADVGSHNLTTLRIAVGEDVLDEVVTELISGNVDERHAWAIWTSLADAVKVAIEEVAATDLQALLDDLRRELVHAVLGREVDDMVDGAGTIRDGTMLADVLDAPVTELTVGDDVDARHDFVDAWALVLLQAILKDVLDNETAGLTKSDLMPHAAKSLVDVLHDLRW